MKKTNKNGVSLIVLIITIIVMIILAATSIMQMSNSGIIDKAKEAVDKSNKKDLEEKISVILVGELAKDETNLYETAQSLKEQMVGFGDDVKVTDYYGNEIKENVNEIKVTVTKDNKNYEYTIDKNFEADVFKDGSILTESEATEIGWIWNNDGEIIGFNNEKFFTETLIIPSKIGNINIIGVDIGDQNYLVSEEKTRLREHTSNANNIKKIIISNGINKVNPNAFSMLYSLEEVLLPPSLNEISESMFDGDFKLKYVNLDNVTTIDNCGFGSCMSINHLVLPNNVENIGFGAFCNCNLKSVVIKSNITFINDYAFASNTSLTSLEMPDTVTEIGEGAFEYCWKLENITIPDSVTTIGKHAFYFCNNIKEIVIPNSVNSISSTAFSRWDASQKIKIPKGRTDLYSAVHDNNNAVIEEY